MRSSFRPTYNMTANLVANYEQAHAEELLEASFASFQREGDRIAADRTIDAMESQLERELAQAHCERGDVEEYLALLESSQPEAHNDRIASTLNSGQVVDVSGGPRDGRYLVLRRLARKDDGARYLVLSTSGRVSTLGYRDVVAGSVVSAEIELPSGFRAKDRRFIQDTMRLLRKLPPPTSNRAPTRPQRCRPPGGGLPGRCPSPRSAAPCAPDPAPDRTTAWCAAGLRPWPGRGVQVDPGASRRARLHGGLGASHPGARGCAGSTTSRTC